MKVRNLTHWRTDHLKELQGAAARGAMKAKRTVKRYRYHLVAKGAPASRARIWMMTRGEARSANLELARIPWGPTVRYREIKR